MRTTPDDRRYYDEAAAREIHGDKFVNAALVAGYRILREPAHCFTGCFGKRRNGKCCRCVEEDK